MAIQESCKHSIGVIGVCENMRCIECGHPMYYDEDSHETLPLPDKCKATDEAFKD